MERRIGWSLNTSSVWYRESNSGLVVPSPSLYLAAKAYKLTLLH